MGFIKEPKGVDFVIQSKPLTEKEKEEISLFIAAFKDRKVKNTNLNRKRDPV